MALTEKHFNINKDNIALRIFEDGYREGVLGVANVDSSGNLAGNNVTTTPGDNFALTAFGAHRVAEERNRFDVEFIYNKQSEIVDEVTAGGGTATHNANPSDVILAVNDANDATEAALYGYDVPYTPGNGQLVEITGTLDDADIGSGTAYIVFRTNISGSVVETAVEQASWNVSTEADIDWTTSQIFRVNFQSLKVGRIVCEFVRNGIPTRVHEFYNDNVRDSGYWQRPSLPPYWRIYNDATYTYMEMGYGDTGNGIFIRYRITANASAETRAICATVKSEAGTALQDLPGFERAIDRGTTTVSVSTTLIPVISIRPAATFNSITNRGLYIPEGFSIAGDNPMRYVLLYRPTLTGPSWTAVDATNSGMEYDVTASAVSGGIVVYSDYFATGRNSDSAASGLLGRTLLRLTRTGTSDILTLAAIRTGTSNSATLAALRWKEIR